MISGVARGRLDADLHGDARDGDRGDPAITQRELKWRPFESRHGQLVEDCFTGQRRELRNDGEARRVA
jgi:hypothetical protein